jgi:TolA-binding protein
MKLSRSLLTAVLCAGLASPAAAQDKPRNEDKSSAAASGSSAAKGSVPLTQNQTRQQLFDQLDANHNGSVSRAEAQESPALVLIFVETDANGDGELSVIEFGSVPLSNPDGSPAK